MPKAQRTAVVALMVLLAACVAGPVSAQDRPGLAGWGKEDPYNQHYQPTEFDDFKGTVEDITDITPLPGMAPGIGLTVRDQDGDLVAVHLGPKDFVKPDAIGLKKGDKVKVKGVWADMGDKEVFIASKIKKGENVELKVRRTKDGVPYWTMAPEELAKEHAEQEP